MSKEFNKKKIELLRKLEQLDHTTHVLLPLIQKKRAGSLPAGYHWIIDGTDVKILEIPSWTHGKKEVVDYLGPVEPFNANPKTSSKKTRRKHKDSSSPADANP